MMNLSNHSLHFGASTTVDTQSISRAKGPDYARKLQGLVEDDLKKEFDQLPSVLKHVQFENKIHRRQIDVGPVGWIFDLFTPRESVDPTTQAEMHFVTPFRNKGETMVSLPLEEQQPRYFFQTKALKKSLMLILNLASQEIEKMQRQNQSDYVAASSQNLDETQKTITAITECQRRIEALTKLEAIWMSKDTERNNELSAITANISTLRAQKQVLTELIETEEREFSQQFGQFKQEEGSEAALSLMRALTVKRKKIDADKQHCQALELEIAQQEKTLSEKKTQNFKEKGEMYERPKRLLIPFKQHPLAGEHRSPRDRYRQYTPYDDFRNHAASVNDLLLLKKALEAHLSGLQKASQTIQEKASQL